MVWVVVELVLIVGERLDLNHSAGGIRIRFIASQTINARIFRLQRTQHVIKGAVLHHQHNDVLQVVQSRAHTLLPSGSFK